MLRIAAHRREDRIAGVDILSGRLPAVEGLLGSTVSEARRQVMSMFHPCGQAHGWALAAACGAARGEPPLSGDAAVVMERSVAAEAAQAHLGRLLLDWPPLFDHAAVRHRCAGLQRGLSQLHGAKEAWALGGELLDLVGDELLSGFFRAMREPTTLAEFVTMARSGGTVGSTLADLIELGAFVPPEEACAPLLPTLSAAQWAAELGGMPGPEFCLAPTWRGQACETGALARHMDSHLVALLVDHGHRIAARLFAQVVDLGDYASRLRHPLPPDLPPLVDAVSLGVGCGLARVETSRGQLLHAVRLEGERIAEYAIVVPSAWNFHPDGPLAREAVGRPASDPALASRRLSALVLALDPCRDFEVRLDEGRGG